jgi:signal transduction histidine kinase
MDKERYGTKGAKGVDSNGTGTGGYIVKSITRHYGGDYDVHSIKLMGMNFTNIIVKLPIYRGEDE